MSNSDAAMDALIKLYSLILLKDCIVVCVALCNVLKGARNFSSKLLKCDMIILMLVELGPGFHN